MDALRFVFVGLTSAAIGALALTYPTACALVYLLVVTRGLGLLDFSWFEVPGLVNVTLFVNSALLAAVIILLMKRRKVPREPLIYLALVGVLFIYGILVPVIRGYSTLVATVTDGKDFLGYSALGFLLVQRKSIDWSVLQRALVAVAAVLSIWEVAAWLWGFVPPGLTAVNPGHPHEGVHVYHELFILLAVLLVVGWIRANGINWLRVTVVVLCATGMLLQGHRAVAAAGVVAGAVLLVVPKRLFVTGRLLRVLCVGGVFAASLLTMGWFSGGWVGSLLRHSAEVVRTDPAVRSRLVYDRRRIQFVRRRPLIGYGFVDETSRLGRSQQAWARSRFESTFGTVDSGLLDLLVRFGAIGLAAVLGAFSWLVWTTAQHVVWPDWAVKAPVVLFLLGYLLILSTWSVLSYELGIVPLSYAVGLVWGPQGASGARAAGTPRVH